MPDFQTLPRVPLQLPGHRACVNMKGPAKHGPVAQMGARVNGIHEVTGSIPVWSTSFTSFSQRTPTFARDPDGVGPGAQPFPMPS